MNLLDDREQSPLFLAALANHNEAVIGLLAAGAQLHLGDSPMADPDVGGDMKMLIMEQLGQY